jgi:hypothetical protein
MQARSKIFGALAGWQDQQKALTTHMPCIKRQQQQQQRESDGITWGRTDRC